MCASDSVCKIAVAKNRKLAIARGISNERASEIGLPVSIDSARANFSRSRSINAAIRSRKFERSAAVFFNQSRNAFSAAATARSTSCPSLSATCEYGLPVAGSMLSRYRPLIGSTNSPLMKLRTWSRSVRMQSENKRILEGSRIARAHGVQAVLAFGWVCVSNGPDTAASEDRLLGEWPHIYRFQ